MQIGQDHMEPTFDPVLGFVRSASVLEGPAPVRPRISSKAGTSEREDMEAVANKNYIDTATITSLYIEVKDSRQYIGKNAQDEAAASIA